LQIQYYYTLSGFDSQPYVYERFIPLGSILSNRFHCVEYYHQSISYRRITCTNSCI